MRGPGKLQGEGGVDLDLEEKATVSVEPRNYSCPLSLFSCFLPFILQIIHSAGTR